MKLDPSPNAVAQWAHFQTGVIFTLIGNGVPGAVACVIYASLKEGWWDRHFESKEVAGSAWEDWIWHICGCSTALVYLWLRGVI